MKRFLLLSLLLAATASYAGQKANSSVYISKGEFDGIVASVRNSSSTIERLDCYVAGTPSYRWMGCYAVDANGQSASCFSTDPNLIATAQGVQGDSYVNVYYDPSGVCTTLVIQTSSAYPPKAP